MIRKILYLLSAKEKRRLAGLIGGNVVISILDIASLGMLLYIVGFYTRQQTRPLPAFMPAWMSDRNSLALIGSFTLFFLVKSIMGYFILQAQYKFVFQVASRISETNMLQYLEGGYPEYVQVDASVHIRKISQQPIEFCQYVLAGCQLIITEGILVTLTVAGIILFNIKLFLLLAALLMPAVLLLAGFTRHRLKTVRRDIKKSSEKSLQHLREALTGFIESNLYEKNLFFSHRYARYQRILNNYISELQVVQGIPARMIEVFAVLGLFILVAFGKWSGENGTIGFVAVGAFLAAAYKIIPGMVKIINISGQVKTYQFTVDDLWQDAQKGFRTPAAARSMPSATLAAAGPIASIAFSKVGFSQAQGRILGGLDFCLRPGEVMGLSGSSGRGKTTIVNLLLGFLSPDEGRILINDKESDAAARRQYWSRIAYVKQQPFLLHDTVLKNITLSDDIVREDRLQEVLRLAGLQRIGGEGAAAPDKIITENGKNISGGQRQRISFARALYKDADLLILDEPFSELDEEAERELLDHCLGLAQQGKMVILITHNRKNLSLCNKIILLDDE